MRRCFLLLPLAAALVLGCNKSETKVTTAPSNKDNQSPPIPDMPGTGKNKPAPSKAE